MVPPPTYHGTRAIPTPGTLPTPRDGDVLVWWATVDDVSPAAHESLHADLDEDTLGRINAMVREEDRRRGVVAHGLLRRLVASTTGTAAPDVRIRRVCANCGPGDHGKPELITGAARPPLQFNLAHSGGVVAVALSGPGTDVGIDVEAFRHDFDWLPARRHVFSDAEWDRSVAAEHPSTERFTLWARKEAAAKTTGHGLAIDLVHAQIDDVQAPLGELDGHLDDEIRRARLVAPERTYELLVHDFDLDGSAAGAVATHDRPGTAPPRVTVVRASLG